MCVRELIKLYGYLSRRIRKRKVWEENC